MKLFDWKTTVTGLILLGIAVYSLCIAANIYITVGLFISAIGLIIAPDSIIENLKLLIKKLINKI